MIAGVVLAAGRSTRLGQPKQLLPYRGCPLLEWSLAAMAASSVDVTVVVLGHDAERVLQDVDLHGARVVYNARYAEGLSTSLQAALAALGPEVQTAVVAVGDQPLLGPDTIDALIAAYAATGAPIVAADYGDHQGTPLLLDRSVWPLAQQIRGDQGARALLRAHPDGVVTVPVASATAADVDTWADYERLRQGE
jgi:CTP:molybdopterin cytidylyltransferase MocA